MTLVIFGSAKKNGFTGRLLQRELSQNREKYPGPVRFFYCFEHFIAPCSGCGECSQTGRCRHGDLAAFHRDFLAAAQLVFAFPVYNGSVPAPLKALLDRFQPYFWTDARKRLRRPAVLHVVGEGGDPHGFEPLVGTVRSALAVAGFRLEAVYDWVGKISGDGEIEAEADVRELAGAESDLGSGSKSGSKSESEALGA